MWQPKSAPFNALRSFWNKKIENSRILISRSILQENADKTQVHIYFQKNNSQFMSYQTNCFSELFKQNNVLNSKRFKQNNVK